MSFTSWSFTRTAGALGGGSTLQQKLNKFEFHFNVFRKFELHLDSGSTLQQKLNKFAFHSNEFHKFELHLNERASLANDGSRQQCFLL